LDAYNFVARKDKLIKEGFKPPIHDFKLYDANAIEYTDSMFAAEGYKLILVQTKIEDSRKGIETAMGNTAKEWMESGKKVWALTASNLSDANAYASKNNLLFTYYNMDAIPLKSMVRSNPGMLLLKNNVVIKKWGAYNLPTYKTLQKYMN